MDWTAIGALGELLGAAAVVATLWYLAGQVRHANRLAQAEAYRAALSGFRETQADWASDREFVRLWSKVQFDGARREDLQREDRLMVFMRYQTLLNLLGQIHADVELGILPAETRDIIPSRTFETPFFFDVWPSLREDLPESFVSSFEARVKIRPSDSLERLPPGANAPSTPPD